MIIWGSEKIARSQGVPSWVAQYDLVLKKMEEENSIDIIYLDFAKAFHEVDHDILLHKVKEIGITGKLGTWLHSSLIDRSHSFFINGISI